MRTTKESNKRIKRTFLWVTLIALLSLSIQQFVLAEPAAQDDFPTDGGMPGLTDGMPGLTDGTPIEPVFMDQELDLSNMDGVDSADAPSDIQIWYGNPQTFGKVGTPQPLVDILGRASIEGGVRSLHYSVNGDADRQLSVGADLRRLDSAGDFHAEIPRSSLDPGPNTVEIILNKDRPSQVIREITVNKETGNVWPNPYLADWSSSPNLLDIAQPVDGFWFVHDGKLKLSPNRDPSSVGYDRVILMGETDWTDYQARIPFTVKALDPSGFQSLSNGPGFGVVMGWSGYEQVDKEQPRAGWQHLGAIAWGRWQLKNNQVVAGMQMIGDSSNANVGQVIGTNPYSHIEIGKNYFMRASVQSVSGSPSIYRLKIWKQGDPEPLAWDIEAEGKPSEPESGSFGLIAHHVEVEIGNISITPTSNIKPKLSVTPSGNGTVDWTPKKDSYDYGEEVTITAFGDGTSIFGRWEGYPAPRQNTLKLRLTGDTDLMAVFVPQNYGKLTVEQEAVTAQPAPGPNGYLIGQHVTVTAIPPTGQRFDKWTITSGSALNGITDTTDNPYRFVFQGNTEVTAVFADKAKLKLTTNTEGNGTIKQSPEPPHYYGDVVKLEPIAGAGYEFDHWEGAVPGATPYGWVLMNSSKTVKAYFREVGDTYTLNVTVPGGNGSVTVDPQKTQYLHGEVVTLTAVPNTGYMFGKWSGDAIGISGRISFAIRENRNIQAEFVPERNPRSDDFNRCVLSDGPWTTYDPLGDSTLKLNGNALEISVPSGTKHTIFNEENTSPRALTPADDDDFEIEARFNSPVDSAIEIMGIVVQESEDTLLRFDFSNNGQLVRLYAASHDDDKTITKVNNPNITGGSPLYMRVRRVGDSWTVSYSYNGTFTDGHSYAFTYKMDVSEVGLFAGNAGSAGKQPPAFTAKIDYFLNTAMPLPPSSGAQNTVSVFTEGQGLVEVSPKKDSYSCGERVSFKAVPASGWNFAGWADDLSGFGNPQALTINGSHQVTAKFSTGPVKVYSFLPMSVRP